MTWFIKKSEPLKFQKGKTIIVPEGMWRKCPACKEIIYRKELERSDQVCPKCDYHFRISPKERFSRLFDDGDYQVHFGGIRSSDPLGFKGLKRYKEQVKQLEKKGLDQEAVVIARGSIDGQMTIICAMDFAYLGGSLGSAAGEKIARAIEMAVEEKTPLIIFSCSGGARMMEGALSLMQMAKISAALARLSEVHVPFISVLTDPTTGGVTASYAMLGDINLAEPKALIGFAGPRVIQQTIKQDLPEGFQRSEFLLEHGMLDAIVTRRNMKKKLSRFLRFFHNQPLAH